MLKLLDTKNDFRIKLSDVVDRNTDDEKENQCKNIKINFIWS
jgi:hypothetical protein